MVRIGYAPRFNLYGVKKAPDSYVVPETPEIVNESTGCCCIPPCECAWLEDYYKESWTLSVLKDLEASGVDSQLQEGDLIVAGAEPAITSKTKTDVKIKPCDCPVPHICHWHDNKYAKEPYVLTVVRLYRSYVESSGNNLTFDCCCKETKE